MPALSTADHSVSPPRIDVPRTYNAACDLLERNLEAGRGGWQSGLQRWAAAARSSSQTLA